MAISILLCAIPNSRAAAPLVTNVVASQRSGTKLIDIRYDVFDNGLYEGSLFGSGGPFIVYAELGALNTFQVIAADEEGNQSSPATYIVDLR